MCLPAAKFVRCVCLCLLCAWLVCNGVDLPATASQSRQGEAPCTASCRSTWSWKERHVSKVSDSPANYLHELCQRSRVDLCKLSAQQLAQPPQLSQPPTSSSRSFSAATACQALSPKQATIWWHWDWSSSRCFTESIHAWGSDAMDLGSTSEPYDESWSACSVSSSKRRIARTACEDLEREQASQQLRTYICRQLPLTQRLDSLQAQVKTQGKPRESLEGSIEEQRKKLLDAEEKLKLACDKESELQKELSEVMKEVSSDTILDSEVGAHEIVARVSEACKAFQEACKGQAVNPGAEVIQHVQQALASLASRLLPSFSQVGRRCKVVAPAAQPTLRFSRQVWPCKQCLSLLQVWCPKATEQHRTLSWQLWCCGFGNTSGFHWPASSSRLCSPCPGCSTVYSGGASRGLWGHRQSAEGQGSYIYICQSRWCPVSICLSIMQYAILAGCLTDFARVSAAEHWQQRLMHPSMDLVAPGFSSALLCLS